MNHTPQRNVVLAVLLAFLAAGLYSPLALCCDADGVGTAKRVASPMPVTVTPASPRIAAPAVAPAAQPSAVGGGAAPTDDAGNSLGDGASPGTHRRGLRWQSFLPGVIK